MFVENPYTRLVSSKVRQLSEQFGESEAIKHAATKGALREAYLRKFLLELAPTNFKLTGGFITDSHGVISPQIDLIGVDDTLPLIPLDPGISVTPIESVRLWIEVKSVLETKHIVGVRKRLKTIQSMMWSLVRDNRRVEFRPGILPFGFIVSYDTDVAEDTMKTWLVESQFLVCIVVIGKYALWNASNDESKTEKVVRTSANEEVLFFLSKIHQAFVLLSRFMEDNRKNIASLSEDPSQSDIEELLKNKRRDLVHFSMQSYFEKG